MARTIPDAQIVAAARKLFIQQGYAGATTRDIAAAAGINEVTLFRRFGNKQCLMKAVVEQESALFRAAGISYTGDVTADLLRIVVFYHELMRSHGHAILTISTEIAHKPELHDSLQQLHTILATITTLIERYQNEGVLIKEPPIQAFLALVGPLFLESVLAIVQPQLFDPPAEPAILVVRYLQGRAAP